MKHWSRRRLSVVLAALALIALAQIGVIGLGLAGWFSH